MVVVTDALAATEGAEVISLSGAEVERLLPAAWMGLYGLIVGLTIAVLWLGVRWAWLRYAERAIPRPLDLPASAFLWAPVVLLLCVPVFVIALYEGVLIDFGSSDRNSVRVALDAFRTQQGKSYRGQGYRVEGQTYKAETEVDIATKTTPDSVEFFDDILDAALRADAKELEKLPGLERAWVLAARGMFTEAELVDISSTRFMDEFHARLKRIETPVRLCPFEDDDVALIKIEGDVARVYKKHDETGQIAVLHRDERGEWLVDIPASFDAWCQEFTRKLEAKGLSESRLDHTYFHVQLRNRSNTGAWTKALPKEAMDGPLDFDLTVYRPYTEPRVDTEPTPPPKPTTAELIAKELESPVTYDAYLDSVSRPDYLQAAFDRKLLSWDSSVVWDAAEYDRSGSAFELAYQVAKVESEEARVEVLRRGLGLYQHFWSWILQRVEDEPSPDLAPDLLAMYEADAAMQQKKDMIRAMGKCADDRIREILDARASSTWDHLRSHCAEALAWTNMARGYELLRILASDPDLYHAQEARAALYRLGFTFEEED